MIKCLNYKFTEERLESIINNKPKEPDYSSESFNIFMDSLSLKELLVYDNEKIYHRYNGYMNQLHLIKQKTISQVTKEFINSELYSQRTTIIQLLIKSDEHEYQYLAYLLYDLLSSDSNSSVDSQEQTLLFDSLPWNIKKHFKDAMKQTITYTNYLTNFDTNNIPLEQQICLLKANDTIKEKAMLKLKEVKAKSEDSGTKARQYLEGLLRIPFGIYRNEPILNVVDECKSIFSQLVMKLNKQSLPNINIPIKDNYTSSEVFNYNRILSKDYTSNYNEGLLNNIESKINNMKRDSIIKNVGFLNNLIKTQGLSYPKICHSGKRSSYMINGIMTCLQHFKTNTVILSEYALHLEHIAENPIKLLEKSSAKIMDKNQQIKKYMKSVSEIMDSSVHGNDKAKRQIERIIGQWINGEKSGYCFGFEGPPGVGKTSLAKKGIANCLKDNDGNSRPFSFLPSADHPMEVLWMATTILMSAQPGVK